MTELRVVAGRQRGRVAVLTPAEDGMRKLCRPEARARALQGRNAIV